MDLLTRIARRSRPYLPFTQPRYKGSYPFVQPRRDLLGITNRLSPTIPLVSTRLFSARRVPLSLYEDRRVWHPEGASALPRSMVEFRTRINERPPNFVGDEIYNPRTGELIYTKASQMSQKTFSPWKLAFDNPWKTVICLKRKMRREIMHAFGYAGKSGFKKPRFTQYSYVKCF